MTRIRENQARSDLAINDSNDALAEAATQLRAILAILDNHPDLDIAAAYVDHASQLVEESLNKHAKMQALRSGN